MNYLLDTHVFIWWIQNDKRLTKLWRETISDINNNIKVSVVTAWEMSIKMRKKKLRLKTAWVDCFGNIEFDVLPVLMSHVEALNALPLYHADPFDRMLVAQALVEGLTLITVDPKVRKYRIPMLA